MTGLEVQAAGVGAFVASCEDAVDQLRNLDQVNADAADQVLGYVDPPYRTGRLASTIGADVDALGFTLRAGGSVAPYAAIVHARNPFLTKALTVREDAVVGVYAAALADVVDTIKGA